MLVARLNGPDEVPYMASEKIIDKLRKIQAMADGAAKIGSDVEAQAFAEMLQKMLLTHKLAMSDIEFAQMEQEEPVMQRDVVYPPNPDAARNYGNPRKTRVAWMESLAGIIARAHFCNLYTYKGSSRMGLIGRPSDIEIAEYMIVTLTRAADRLGYIAKQTFKKELADAGLHVSQAAGFRESWVTAFTYRLSTRYEAERRAATSQTQGLVRVNKSDAAVKAYMMEKAAGFKKGTVAKGRAAGHQEGYKRGREAADAIELRANGIKSGNAVKGELQ